jgi:endonuclease YncB( thermonuclease family)
MPQYRRITTFRLLAFGSLALRGLRGGVLAAFLAAGFLAVEFTVMCGCVGAQEQNATPVSAAPAGPCGGGEIARGHVDRVVDGRDFVLNGGRQVHLAAIEVPLPPPPQALYAAPGGAAARTALASLLSGAQLVLRQAEVTSDRYGRTVAYAEILAAGSQRSAEAEMISAGFAEVSDDAGSQACAAELLRRETVARKAKLGLWADSYYDPIPADKPADIISRRGHFALIEGQVVSVHESGATLYVNFGRHWSQDFAVTIRRRDERNFAAAGLDLQGLAGRQVRVRGWIEAHSANANDTGAGFWRAPWIEVAHTEQIELADHDEAGMTR